MKHWFIYGKQQASHLKIKLNISDIGLDIEKKISIDQVYSISVLLFFTLSSMQSPPHHHILSCSFGIYFCFFCLDLYDKHKANFVCLLGLFCLGVLDFLCSAWDIWKNHFFTRWILCILSYRAWWRCFQQNAQNIASFWNRQMKILRKVQLHCYAECSLGQSHYSWVSSLQTMSQPTALAPQSTFQHCYKSFLLPKLMSLHISCVG